MSEVELINQKKKKARLNIESILNIFINND